MSRARTRHEREPGKPAEREPDQPLPPAAETVLALQRTAGNVAVGQMLARKEAGTQQNQRAVGRALEARVDAVLTAADTRHRAVVAAIEKSVEDVDATVVALNELTNVYEGEYNKVKGIIEAGKGRIAAVEAFTNAVLGVAIGTAVGLSLGAIPLLAASTSRITKTLTEVGGEVTEWATAQGVDKLRSGATGTGGEAALARMDPLLKRLDIYRDAADAYRQLALLGRELGALAAVSTWCAVTKAHARELATSGTLSGSVTGADLERQVVALERAADLTAKVDEHVRELSDRTLGARTSAEKSAREVDRRRVERHIWLRWMGALQGEDELDVLDAEPVQDRLEGLHIMGGNKRDTSEWSDVGWYVGTGVDEDEEAEGRDIAKQYSMGLDFVGKVGVLSDAQTGHVTSGTVTFDGMPWYKRTWDVMIDDWVSSGIQVQITHAVGNEMAYRPRGRPTLYGRPVKSDKPDKHYADMAAGRRNQLI